MKLAYKDSLPFEIKTPKKSLQISITNEIADDFNHYFMYIITLYNNDDFDKNIFTEDLSNRYKPIALKIEEEIRRLGNKKAKHTQYETEFILACSYKLIESMNFNQEDLATVFGLKANAFSKLGIYPIRSYEAYNKLRSGYLSMKPAEFGKPRAVDIADYINKHIQAPYACSSTILIANDLDLIVNVATTDVKDYLLVRPYNNCSNIFFKDTNYAFARYIFALSNHLSNKGKKYPAGKVKQKILDIIDMKDSSAIVGGLRTVFAGEDSLSKYVKQNETTFNKYREEYKFHLETIRRANTYIEDGYVPVDIEYFDEHFGAYNIVDFHEEIRQVEKDRARGIPHFETSEDSVRYGGYSECNRKCKS